MIIFEVEFTKDNGIGTCAMIGQWLIQTFGTFACMFEHRHT